MSEFLKNNQGKPDMARLPWQEIEEVAAVENHGAQCYEPLNWQKGDAETYINAALRHISARLQGRMIDDKGKNPSHRSHLAHAVCDLLFAMWLDRKGKKPPPEKVGVRFGWGGGDTEDVVQKMMDEIWADHLARLGIVERKQGSVPPPAEMKQHKALHIPGTAFIAGTGTKLQHCDCIDDIKRSGDKRLFGKGKR